MPPKKYRPFHTFIQRLAATAPGSWLLGHLLRYLDRFVIWLSAGRTSLTSILAGVPVIMVTTTGAQSGQPRTTPLLPVRDPAQSARFALIASNWGQQRLPSWYHNLKNNPHAMCRVDGHVESYGAREVAGEEYERLWEYAVDTYFGYALYRERAGRHIPILVLEKE